MATVIYWFRNDLRLFDNPALTQACNAATQLLPVYIHAPDFDGDAVSRWGFALGERGCRSGRGSTGRPGRDGSFRRSATN